MRRLCSVLLLTAMCLAFSACTVIRYDAAAGTAEYVSVLQRKSFVVEKHLDSTLTIRYNADSDALAELLREMQRLGEIAAKAAAR